MANDKTREETVKENREAVISRYGEDSYMIRLLAEIADISDSLAMLVDNK
jgi:hypothetical protein